MKLTFSQLKYMGAFRLPRTDLFQPCRGGIEKRRGLPEMWVKSNPMGWSLVNVPALDPAITDRKQLPAANLLEQGPNLRSVDFRGEKKDRMLHSYEVNGKLLFNMIQQYDADTPNMYHLGRLDLTTGEIDGLYAVEGKYLATGWMGELPKKWADLLGWSHYMGNAHMFSIVGRSPSGPTFFGVNLGDVADATPDELLDGIDTEMFLGYKNRQRQALFKTKYPDKTERYGFTEMHYNVVENRKNTNPDSKTSIAVDYPGQADPAGNDVWTIRSRVGDGFVVGDTYVCIGSSAGHRGGMGYRIIDSNGKQWKGPASYLYDDYGPYYWLYDMNDLLRVKRGELKPYEVLPYEYGPWQHPLTNITHQGTENKNEIIGGSYDETEGVVYLSLRSADGNKPVIMALQVTDDVQPRPEPRPEPEPEPEPRPEPEPMAPVVDALNALQGSVDDLRNLLIPSAD